MKKIVFIIFLICIIPQISQSIISDFQSIPDLRKPPYSYTNESLPEPPPHPEFNENLPKPPPVGFKYSPANAGYFAGDSFKPPLPGGFYPEAEGRITTVKVTPATCRKTFRQKLMEKLSFSK